MFDIPEGWVQVVAYDNSLFVHPKEFNVYEDNVLTHCYVYITDYNLFRVYDKVTGIMLRCKKKDEVLDGSNTDSSIC